MRFGRNVASSHCRRSRRTPCGGTYISLILEAGAPLPYVMDQVGHLDSKTTLEIYAQVQKRVSRTKVHLAFDELLANAVDARSTPTADAPNVNRS
jgi:hypothetical protein